MVRVVYKDEISIDYVNTTDTSAKRLTDKDHKVYHAPTGRKTYRMIAISFVLLCILQVAVNVTLRLFFFKTGNLTRNANTLEKLKADDDFQQGWVFFGSSLYFISSTKLPWLNSREICLRHGADLVVINTVDEQNFMGKFHRLTWLGLTYQEETGTWDWVDGTPLTKSYWGENEPNGYHGRNESCVEIRQLHLLDKEGIINLLVPLLQLPVVSLNILWVELQTIHLLLKCTHTPLFCHQSATSTQLLLAPSAEAKRLENVETGQVRPKEEVNPPGWWRVSATKTYGMRAVVGPDGIAGWDKVQDLASYLVGLREASYLTEPQVTEAIRLWTALPDFDKKRVIYQPRHQPQLTHGRFKTPKRSGVTPGVESVKRDVVLSSPRLMDATTIQLFELNQRTLIQWFQRYQKTQEKSVLTQGLTPPDPVAVADSQLPSPRKKMDEAPSTSGPKFQFFSSSK
ncbi:hypothetical protein OJAV_G00003950 [Oryzias javanicus]|uniref:C-type lectin domain-containing protein n=1 Tax=Oryzias javanicus TaxID=123683 RepID=A0A3S2N7I1_ORYJA|nr:hypothetical protein OJAV_G00003950 [Oryzias javanicus]